MYDGYRTPGVYRRDTYPPPPAGLVTGVPAFLGVAERLSEGQRDDPQLLTLWPQFGSHFREPSNGGYLSAAVRGFFENGGRMCYVARLESADVRLVDVSLGGIDLEDEAAVAAIDAEALRTAVLARTGQALASNLQTLRRALTSLEPLETVDLVCAPDILRLPMESGLARLVAMKLPELPGQILARCAELQAEVLLHCDRMGDRLAILDSAPYAGDREALRRLPSDLRDTAMQQHEQVVLRQRQQLKGANGALYYPWIGLTDGAAVRYVPPCGHVAGLYARTDAATGVHRPPANGELRGSLDVELDVSDTAQDRVYPQGVNCVRAFPGRGIRVWGARTVSLDPIWMHVNVRRLFLTAGRWIERNLIGTTFEPNDPTLWARIRRDLGAYCAELYRRGALQGDTPEQAYYVQCDAQTNPRETRDQGMVVTQVGLAPTVPNEFVVVHFVHSEAGVSLATPVAT